MPPPPPKVVTLRLKQQALPTGGVHPCVKRSCAGAHTEVTGVCVCVRVRCTGVCERLCVSRYLQGGVCACADVGVGHISSRRAVCIRVCSHVSSRA